MLVARRDPPFHTDADPAASNANSRPTPRAPKLPRIVMFTQLFGSLVAVSVGIASAYSFYRANFSPETMCPTLRSGIIALLDKSVDAATRRVLVRRDVETFEKTCAAVDPEATAAFKSLLGAEKTVASPAPPPPAAAPAAQKPQRSEPAPKEPAPKEAVRKPEPRPQVTAKQPPANTAPVAAEPARRDAAVSDAQWLEAVRQALVTQKPDRRPVEAAKPSVVAPVARPVTQETPVQPVEAAKPSVAAPVARPVMQETPLQPPADVRPDPATTSIAPALPRPITIPAAPAQRVDADHPVPPESIPDAPPPAKPNEPERSRIGKWISEIPLLGPVLDNGRR